MYLFYKNVDGGRQAPLNVVFQFIHKQIILVTKDPFRNSILLRPRRFPLPNWYWRPGDLHALASALPLVMKGCPGAVLDAHPRLRSVNSDLVLCERTNYFGSVFVENDFFV